MIKKEATQLSQALLNWFSVSKREMPWRETKDPYHIWVSEIMLQQTQVITVHDYFKRFIKAFPTVFDLAKADQEKVLKLWEGLGYYSRARNLHKGAKYITEAHQGKLPQTLEEILKVPGIGPYSAGAILSIAHNKSIPAIDGNVNRVISRVYAFQKEVQLSASQKQIKTWVESLIPQSQAGDFNQALMELGALICTPKSPQCQNCPIQAFCQGDHLGIAAQLPHKKKKKPPQKWTLLVAVIRNESGEFLLEKQREQGIFKDLWCFPYTQSLSPSSDSEQIQAFSSALLNQDCQIAPSVFEVQHTLTHRKLTMPVFLIQAGNALATLPEDSYQWVDFTKENHLAMPVAHQKIQKKLRLESSHNLTVHIPKQLSLGL